MVSYPSLIESIPLNSGFSNPFELGGISSRACRLPRRRRRRKNTTRAARVKTPTLTPAPIPAFFPAWEWEEGGTGVGVRLETEVGPKAELQIKLVDVIEGAVVEVLVVELDTPILDASMTRLFIAQHASKVKFPSQHQLP